MPNLTNIVLWSNKRGAEESTLLLRGFHNKITPPVLRPSEDIAPLPLAITQGDITTRITDFRSIDQDAVRPTLESANILGYCIDLSEVDFSDENVQEGVSTAIMELEGNFPQLKIIFIAMNSGGQEDPRVQKLMAFAKTKKITDVFFASLENPDDVSALLKNLQSINAPQAKMVFHASIDPLVQGSPLRESLEALQETVHD